MARAKAVGTAGVQACLGIPVHCQDGLQAAGFFEVFFVCFVFFRVREYHFS